MGLSLTCKQCGETKSFGNIDQVEVNWEFSAKSRQMAKVN